MQVAVTLPDGSVREVAAGTTCLQLAEQISRSLAKKAVGARIDGQLADIRTPLAKPARVEILTSDDADGLAFLRHSAAHLLAEAVTELWPETKVAIGPVIADGFYYDFDRAEPFTPEDLEQIEKVMRKHAAAAEPIERSEIPHDEARRKVGEFRDSGEVYKAEILEGILGEPGSVVSFYRQADFTDLCEGPHVPNTGFIRHFKLLSVAGAYWRGDEKNKMLQRIYGTAYFKEDDLKAHLHRLEEAAKRDHRKLGKELDLFGQYDDIGPGLILWHPKGALIRYEIENFWRKAHYDGGYELVFTPHIAKTTLWDKSGHTGFYKDNMFSGMDVDGQEYLVKPMNCPYHVQIYRHRTRSYRDLPLRWAELGTVYRYERSGVLHGLLRVRGFTQDDAHLFVRPDQLETELDRVIEFVLYILRTFGFTEFEAYLATRPDKFVGEPALWERATAALRDALTKNGLTYEVDEGGGAFYGPKIDLKLKDTLGRAWQCSTIQVDFNFPERFDLTFTGADGKEHRPVMIHRALMGSMERFFGCLIEHYAGHFPLWLCPVQCSVFPIATEVEPYAEAVAAKLRAAGLRVDYRDASEHLNSRIKDAQRQKIPYMAVVGNREAEANSVALRLASGKQQILQLDELASRLQQQANEKALFPPA
ncbi:MAG: threonine--tRNA ligase [Cyanobacteria bacterium REEB65]|nr:threonine--tRNA ligase [Cyanobacteria bacterium REEB65]